MNIEKIKPTVATTIVNCVGLFSIVILSFFLLNRPLFFVLNLWQLVAIGLGLSIPILALYTFIMSISSNRTKETDDDIMRILSGASLSGMFIMTLLLFISYLIGLSLKTYYCIFFIICFTLALGSSISSTIKNSKLDRQKREELENNSK